MEKEISAAEFTELPVYPDWAIGPQKACGVARFGLDVVRPVQAVWRRHLGLVLGFGLSFERA